MAPNIPFLPFIQPIPAQLPFPPFSLNELNSALHSTKMNSSPDLDGVTGMMIKALSPLTREFLLVLFNRTLFQSSFPVTWRRTTVIFIPKPGGKGYRSIALTSVLSKIFEKLIQGRLDIIQRWQSAIPRKDFIVKSGQVVCHKHFLLEDVVWKKEVKPPSDNVIASVSKLI